MKVMVFGLALLFWAVTPWPGAPVFAYLLERMQDQQTVVADVYRFRIDP